MEADGSSQKPLTAEGRFNQLPQFHPMAAISFTLQFAGQIIAMSGA